MDIIRRLLEIFILFQIVNLKLVDCQAERVKFVKEPASNIYVALNSSVSVQCLVNIYNAEYNWIRVEDDNERELKVTPTDYLSFDKVTGLLKLMGDSSVVGRYRCEATMANLGVVISQVFSVEISGIYEDDESLVSIQSSGFNLGDVVLLKCPLYTVPPQNADYHWYFKPQKSVQSKRLDQLPKRFPQPIFHRNSKFVEINLSDSAQFGSYVCRATDKVNKQSKQSNWINIKQAKSKLNKQIVSGDIYWLFLPDEYINDKDNKNVIRVPSNKDSLYLLSNAISTIGPVSIEWYHGKTLLSSRNQNKYKLQYELIGKTGLKLTNLATSSILQDIQDFSCQVTDLTYKNVTKKFMFQIIMLPYQLLFQNGPSRILNPAINTRLVLDCSIRSFPTVRNNIHSITWRKNGEKIGLSDYLKKKGDKLIISNVLKTDEGIFQCFVDNGFNSISAIMQLKIQEKSNKLTGTKLQKVIDFRGKPLSNGTFKLSWKWGDTKEAFKKLTHYKIFMDDLVDEIEEKKVFTVPKNVMSYFIDNLPADHFYRLEIIPFNRNVKGFSAWIRSSAQITPKMLEAAPRDIKAYMIGSTTVTIRWQPVSSVYGLNIRYQVICTSDSVLNNKFDKVTAESSIKLNGLTRATTYTIIVRALNRIGPGNFSNELKFITESKPNVHDPRDNSSPFGPVEITKCKVFNTTVYIVWKHASIKKNVPIDHYKVHIYEYYPNKPAVIVKFPKNDLKLTVELNKQYTIKITAFSKSGEGGVSLFKDVNSKSKDSGEIPIPLNIKLFSIKIDRATLSWDDKGTYKSHNRLYQVRLKKPESSKLHAPFEVVMNSTDTRVTLTNLLPHTRYDVSVRTGDISLDSNKKPVSRYRYWSDWSMKEDFYTQGYKPLHSPQILSFFPGDAQKTYQKVEVRYESPYGKSSNSSYYVGRDPVTLYVVYFTSKAPLRMAGKYELTPESLSIELDNWEYNEHGGDNFMSSIEFVEMSTVYYLRIGCKTKNYHCPLSRLYLYRTPDKDGKNYGELYIPPKYHFNASIPKKYLTAPAIQKIISTESPGNSGEITETNSFWWIIFGGSMGAVLVLGSVAIITIICFCKRGKSDMNGYKIGTKSSMVANKTDLNATGLLLSNNNHMNNMDTGHHNNQFQHNHHRPSESPALSQNDFEMAVVSGKLSPHNNQSHHYVNSYGTGGSRGGSDKIHPGIAVPNQMLHTPDLFPQIEPSTAALSSNYGGGGTLESDSNPDNDSLRFASVSQHHLAPISSGANLIMPGGHHGNFHHDLVRHHSNHFSNVSNPVSTPANSAISPPIQFINSNNNNPSSQLSAVTIASQYHHPFNTTGINNSNINQPLLAPLLPSYNNPNLSMDMGNMINHGPGMVNATGHTNNTNNTAFPNTPRVNASELVSNTSSEDVRPSLLMHQNFGLHQSRLSENDMSQFCGNVSNNGMTSPINGFHEANSNTVRSQNSATHSNNNPNVQNSQKPIRTSQSHNNNIHENASYLNNNNIPNEKGFSTEELTQEMANLEGLMKDLNAITQKEFEC